MTESKSEQAYREGMEAGLAFGIGYSAAEKGIKPHSTNTNAAFLHGYEAVITGYWPSKRSVPYTADVLWEKYQAEKERSV